MQCHHRRFDNNIKEHEFAHYDMPQVKRPTMLVAHRSSTTRHTDQILNAEGSEHDYNVSLPHSLHMIDGSSIARNNLRASG